MQSSKNIISPLRYPGSKRHLVDYIKETLIMNNLSPSLFIEPFFGGGSIGINLLLSNTVHQALFVDIDPWITSYWQSVFYDTDWLIDQLFNIPATMENWYSIKKSNPQSVRDQAITCLFLNRTSFSGILEKRAGPIGGKNQTSNYPIDCRFTSTTRKNIAKRIETISQFRNQVYGIWNCSWSDAISRIRIEQKAGIFPQSDLFFYFDPPFFNQGEALYRHYFTEQDHLALRDYLFTLSDKWLLSYDSVDQVRELYREAISNGKNGAKHHDIELLYTITNVSKRKSGKEIIISNFDKLPEYQFINRDKPDEEE